MPIIQSPSRFAAPRAGGVGRSSTNGSGSARHCRRASHSEIDGEGDVIRDKLGIPKKRQSSEEEIARLRRSHNQPFPALETDFFGVPSSGIANVSPTRNWPSCRFFSRPWRNGGRPPPGRLARSAPIFHRLIIRLMTVMSLPVSRLNVEDPRPSTGSTSATRPSVWWNRFGAMHAAGIRKRRVARMRAILRGDEASQADHAPRLNWRSLLTQEA